MKICGWRFLLRELLFHFVRCGSHKTAKPGENSDLLFIVVTILQTKNKSKVPRIQNKTMSTATTTTTTIDGTLYDLGPYDLGTAPLAPKQTCVVKDGKRMSYYEGGGGKDDGNGNSMMTRKSGDGKNIEEPTFVFLHGNPTNNYLWRNVIPELEHRGRCIAPDLIGMGESDKLDNVVDDTSYTYYVHYDYLETFLDKCVNANSNVVLVIHDWGSGLGFHWASQHSDKVKGMRYVGYVLVMSRSSTVLIRGVQVPGTFLCLYNYYN